MPNRNDYQPSMPWQLIGNGPKNNTFHTSSLQFHTNVVVFNHGFEELTTASRIYNAMLAKSDSPRCINGILATKSFSMQLAQSYLELSSALKQIASVGLTTLHALTQTSEKYINVIGMTLLPSLVKTTCWAPNQVVPSHYHNWLGERRIALNLCQQFPITWPDLTLKSNPIGHDWIANPDRLLLELQQQPANTKALVRLSTISAKCWLEHLSIDTLTALEPLFHLDRKSHRSKNWWLFNHEASFEIARIQYTLAWCQQSLLLST